MAIQLHTTTFNGTLPNPSNPLPPSTIERKDSKIGKTLIAASGKRNFVSRSAFKPLWTLRWDEVNLSTRNAVKAIHALNSTFTFVDEQGSNWTVQCEEDDAYSESTSFTDNDGNIYYTSVTLIIHIAT